FPGREVKEFTVSDSHGIGRETILPPGTAYTAINGNRITLPKFAMKRRDMFSLVVVVRGRGKGGIWGRRPARVASDGGSPRAGGKVGREAGGRGRVARNIAFGAVLGLLAGVQAGVTFAPRPAAVPSSCGSGRLMLEGSTAFAPVATVIGREYASMCHGASISV